MTYLTRCYINLQLDTYGDSVRLGRDKAIKVITLFYTAISIGSSMVIDRPPSEQFLASI